MSFDKPISLADARAKREASEPSEHVTCKVCGNVWWTTSVVIDENTSHVVGYDADMVCVECGGVR